MLGFQAARPAFGPARAREGNASLDVARCFRHPRNQRAIDLAGRRPSSPREPRTLNICGIVFTNGSESVSRSLGARAAIARAAEVNCGGGAASGEPAGLPAAVLLDPRAIPRLEAVGRNARLKGNIGGVASFHTPFLVIPLLRARRFPWSFASSGRRSRRRHDRCVVRRFVAWWSRRRHRAASYDASWAFVFAGVALAAHALGLWPRPLVRGGRHSIRRCPPCAYGARAGRHPPDGGQSIASVQPGDYNDMGVLTAAVFVALGCARGADRKSTARYAPSSSRRSHRLRSR
jgi:hypothetical protein